MPVKTFKANLYEVKAGDSDEPLADDTIVEAIKASTEMSLAERSKLVNDKMRRIEDYELTKEFWLLNFVTAEFSGPGRTAAGTPTEPIELDHDENFAHETAMLYDPRRQMVLLESGVGGLGPGAARQYLAIFAKGSGFRLEPSLDAEASARARRFQEIRRMEYRVAIGQPSAIDEQAGMGAINSFAKPHGADEVTIVVKAERSKSGSLSLGHVLSTMRNLVTNKNEHQVTGLKVYGRENEDDRLEEINLFLPTVKSEQNLRVDETARKIKHELRWDALREFHAGLFK